MSFTRFVALGDSFTEGVGDDDATRPNGVRGWADRVAEVLAARAESAGEEFGYANLAIRGRKLAQIVEEQVGAAIALAPDLITIYAGANDILRPSVALDDLAATYDEAIGRLAATGATVGIFTAFDPGAYPLFRPVRGRYAIYSEWVREIADTHGCTVIDMWRMRGGPAEAMWAADRLHLNALGHHLIADKVLDTFGVAHAMLTPELAPRPVLSRSEARREHAAWAKEHLAPWVHRRMTGRSSGDGMAPKRPALEPITPAG